MATRTSPTTKKATTTTPMPAPTPGAQVLIGGLWLNQGGHFICAVVPDAPLRWHPDEAGVYVDVGGVEQAMTMKRTAKPKTLAAGKEAVVEGHFVDDRAGADWMVLRLQNLGQPVEIWHSWVIEQWERAAKKKWRAPR